jgi:hypothetical protein
VSGHTPGPWQKVRHGNKWEIHDATGYVVAIVSPASAYAAGNPDAMIANMILRDVDSADANLLVVGPEMYELLKEHLRLGCPNVLEGPARALIAKIEGAGP